MSFTGQTTITGATGMNTMLYTDNSSYADEDPMDRRITLTLADGTTVVPEGTETTYIDWPISAGNTIEVSLGTRDIAPVSSVQWLSPDPQPGSSYTSTVIIGLNSYNDQGEYGVEQAMTANTNIVQNTNYLLSLFQLQLENDNALGSVYYQQQIPAQSAMDRADYLLNNQLKLF